MTIQECPRPESDQSAEQRARPSRALAVASLACGIVSLPLSVVVLGALFGFLGLVFGATQLLTSRTGRRLAWTGAGLSALGFVASSVVLFALLFSLRQGLSNINKTESLDAWVGAEAPDFIAPDAEGGHIQLANYRGKRVILDFKSPHCSACEKEVAYFTELRSTVSPDDLAIIGVMRQDAAAMHAFVDENHINYPVVSAAGLPQPYSEITTFPTAVFIDRNGVIQKILIGYSSLEELKTHALAEDAPRAPAAQ
ncbi:MAG: redoxin domain-containing protein [Candidatus Hydrogenedentes bacterium]|nr:redoxin domain-containing protein [Candidatus Hydrogenedentota bacterium]